MNSRLLKKAHLLRWRARRSLQRTWQYASHCGPSGTPPCIWAFLSNLGE